MRPAREVTEEFEDRFLSEFATKSIRSRGRQVYEPPCDLRTEFQRDRDRIIHSKAFRRLKHKTQVFFAPEGDHYRTRLTHTLEVAQISRTIARCLRLNEDLTEAIALGHDLGHTPFGHSGEAALDEVYPGRFRHNEQSLRVVDVLEASSTKRRPGLNLTWEVRDGILNHRTDGHPATLEGQVVKIGDKIAYINHDIDDAVRAGIISEDMLPRDAIGVLGRTKSERIATMVRDVIEMSFGRPEVGMSDRVYSAMRMLRDFMFEKVYIGSAAKNEDDKAKSLVKQLYAFYIEHPEILCAESHYPMDGDMERAAVDYIAGMTDRYAVTRWLHLFMPAPWRQY